MPRRLFPLRPKELATKSEKWECEIFVIEKEPIQKGVIKFQLENETGILVKDMVEIVCEKLGILPINKALFGISSDVFGGSHYFPYSHKLAKEFISKTKLYFRMQFKVDCTRMHETDPRAFKYFLLQCRHDFVYGRYKENFLQISDELKKQEMLLRMLILETLLVSKDENLSKKDGAGHLQQIIKRKHPFCIENILTKYVDGGSKSKNDEVKKCKKIIEKSLPMFENVTKPEIDFVREVGFLPEYAKENFKCLKKVYGRQDVTAIDDIWLSIHPDEGIVRMRMIDGRFKKADEKTPFRNVAYLVIKQTDLSTALPKFQLMIGKMGNQQTEVISSNSEEELLCICSWIDGYYRLFVDQYTSLLEDKATEFSIHGPIERDVCIHLMEKINCTDGDFVVRERRDHWKEFVLTVRVKSEYKHHEIHCVEEGRSFSKRFFIEENRGFSKLEELLKYYQEGKGPLHLGRMIKPLSTGPVPFRRILKEMPILKRAVPSTPSIEIQLLDSKTLIKKRALRKDRGHFGEVWECMQRREKDLKAVAVRFLCHEISQQGFEKLYHCCKQMMNRMIVRITGCSLSSDNPKFLAFEYMDGGELDDYLLKNSKSIRYRTLLKFLVDIAEGMMYLEREMNLVHGNLNCHNILRLENGDIKISDACFDPILQEDKKLTDYDLNKSCNWRAPEVLKGGTITHLSDAWSYGMTVWQIMSLSKPFGSVSMHDMLELITRKTLPSFLVLPYCPKEIKDILESCWELVPEKRNNFTSIRESLDVYKSGCRIGTNIEKDIETKGSKFPVPTYLLERHYYLWKEEELAECEEKEREGKKLREMKNKMWQEPASSAESSNSGGSSTESGYAVMKQSDTSGYGSADSCDMQKHTSWSISNNEIGDGSKSMIKDDVEMIDLHEKNTVKCLVVAPSSKSERTTSFCRSSMECNSSLLEVSSGLSLNDVEAGKYSTEVVHQSSPEDIICMELNSDLDGKSDDIGRESTDCATDFTFEVDAIAPKRPEKSDEKDGENVTEDIMEVANVLASMAHQRTTDQKRARNSDSTLFVQKHPRRDSPTESSSAESRVSLKEQSNAGPNFYVDQKQRSSFADIDGNKIISGKADSQNMQATWEPPMELQDSEYTERKKRSHSVSEEIARMQKRAARRALDIPNPFNLGSTVPKNFLLPLKVPFSLPTQGKPEDISKYFISPPAKNAIDLNAQEGKHKELKNEDSGYKAITDIPDLESTFSSLKAASPGQSGAPSNTSPKISISHSLTYVVPPNQQVSSQILEHPHYQSTINTYLANIGQPLVTGNPVLVPQLAVGASPGQSMGTAQILQVLQAQQKVTQLTQSISRDKSDQEKPSEGSFRVGAPECMQTLFAILASKNVAAPELANSQHPVAFPFSAAAQHAHSLPSSTPFITTKSDFNVGKAINTFSETIDNSPRPALSSADIKQSGTDIVMIPIHSSSGEQLPQPTPIDVMRPFKESSVRTLSNQRPLLFTRNPSTNQLRAPHLILPKNLTEPRVRLEQSNDVKPTPRHVSLGARQYNPDASKRILPSNDFAVSEIKAEPSSPTSQGYVPAKPASPRTPFDNQHPSPFFKPSRRGGGGSKSKSAIISQLGDLKVFRKEDLVLEKKLGEGQFGEVYKALLKFQRDGSIIQCPVAVKKLKSDDQVPLGIIEEFKNEVKQMASLNNDYIVKLIGVCVDAGDLSDPLIITELMPYGSLDQFIVKHRGTIVQEILLTFAIQIAKGMEFLQSCRIVHRDLATRNVLVESRDRVKVCDFGLSRMFGEKDYYRSHNGKARIPVRWFAPESIKELKFTAESDVWSYGVTIWEMFELWSSSKEHANPYEDLKHTEILDFLTSGGRLQKPKKCSSELWSIIIGCWRHRPDERHSFYRLWDEIRRLIS